MNNCTIWMKFSNISPPPTGPQATDPPFPLFHHPLDPRPLIPPSLSFTAVSFRLMSMLAHCSPCSPFTMPATHRSNHSSCSHLSHAHYSPCSPHMNFAHNSPSLHPTVLTTQHAPSSPFIMPFTHHAHHTHHPQS